MMAHVPIPMTSIPATPPPRIPNVGRLSPMVCPLAKLGRSSPPMDHPRYRRSPSIDVSYRRSPLDPSVYSHARGTPSPLEPSVYMHHFPPRVPPPAPLGGFRNLSSTSPGSVSETSLTNMHPEVTNYRIPDQLPPRPINENVPTLYQQRLRCQVDPLRCSPALRRASSPTPDHTFLFQAPVLDTSYKVGRSSPSLDQGYHTLVSPSPGPSTPGPWGDYNPFTQSSTKGKKTIPGKGSGCSLIDRLPDEAMVRVFSFLNSSELCVCARVCRRWNVLAWDPALWRTIQLNGESVSGDKAVRCVLRRLCGQGPTGACSTVQKVLVSDGAKISDKGLIQLARRCPELTHLQLQGCSGVNNHALFEVTAKCGNLQHLDLTGCTSITSLTTNSIPESSLSARLLLQYLDLTDCSAVDDCGLKLIVRTCPQLVYLYLRRCVRVTDAGIKFVPSFCSGLRELSVSDCNRVTDFGLHELAKLGATLRYLSVAKCEQVSDVGLKVIARRCYKLRYLNARGCEAVSDDALTVLARSCPRLRALDIGKCDVSDAGLRALAESCPNLKKLSLRNCDLVTDRGVQCVAYYCRGLQQLNIQDCHISLEGYRAVKKYCKRCVIEHTNPGFF